MTESELKGTITKEQIQGQEDIRVYLLDGKIVEIYGVAYPDLVMRRGEIIRTFTEKNILKVEIIIMMDAYGLEKGDKTIVHLGMKNECIFNHIKIKDKKEVIIDRL